MIRRISKLVFLGVVGAAFIISIAATWGTAQDDPFQSSSHPIANGQRKPASSVPFTPPACTLVTQCSGPPPFVGTAESTESPPLAGMSPVPATHAGLMFGVTTIDGQLQPVRHFLATKPDLSPTEAELKAAIDNYLLNTKVESAIGNLMKIVEEAPTSLQGKQAQAAIDALKQSLPPPSKFDPAWPGYQKPPEGFEDSDRD